MYRNPPVTRETRNLWNLSPGVSWNLHTSPPLIRSAPLRYRSTPCGRSRVAASPVLRSESGICGGYRYCMYARFPHALARTRKALSTLQGPRQRLGQNARLCSALRAPRAALHRVGARSHPRRTGCITHIAACSHPQTCPSMVHACAQHSDLGWRAWDGFRVPG